jgi:hypothetical protein
MPIRLKVLRRKEQQISKVKELMEMYNVNPSYSNYEGYQPIGASSLSVTGSIDPRIQKTKDLFQMFRLDR